MAHVAVSVYVPCYNSGPYLERVLRAVFAQTVPPDEVIVVDDCSQDRSVEIAERFPVRIIRHTVNQGLAAARNTAVRAARNELVAAVTHDAAPEPEWLERLVPHFEDPKVALGCGKLVEGVQTRLADRWRAAHLAQHWGDAALEDPPTVYGANTIVRRSAVLEAGGWDVRQVRTYHEDGHIYFVLRGRGWKAFYEPAARCQHLRTDSLSTALESFWLYRCEFLVPAAVPTAWAACRLLKLAVLRAGGCGWRDLRAGRYALLGMDALVAPFAFRTYARLRRSDRPELPLENRLGSVCRP
jgi:glycosyltransferase involved in cell wall biosynthesis